MRHVQIGHQRTHGWANADMSIDWQLWTIAVSTRADLDDLLILLRDRSNRRHIHFLRSFPNRPLDLRKTGSTCPTLPIADLDHLAPLLIPFPLMACNSHFTP